MVKDDVFMQYRTLEPMLINQLDKQIVQSFVLLIRDFLPFAPDNVDANRRIVMPDTMAHAARIVHKAINLARSVDGVVRPTTFLCERRDALFQGTRPRMMNDDFGRRAPSGTAKKGAFTSYDIHTASRDAKPLKSDAVSFAISKSM